MVRMLSVAFAQTPLARTVGLIGRASVAEDGGMAFERCSSIHTFFMRMPIDVLFLDEERRVVRAVAGVRPWRPFVGCSEASCVVELAEGAIERRGIAVGQLLELRERRDAS